MIELRWSVDIGREYLDITQNLSKGGVQKSIAKRHQPLA
jgi:hypothetical protein